MKIGELVSLNFESVYLAMSFLLSVYGSFLALQLASSISKGDGKVDAPSLWGAAVALGGVAIWCMHFIGMYAHKMPFPVAYDAVLTLISLVAAVVISALALRLSVRTDGELSSVVMGGVIAGLGVAVMHYMGMMAMVSSVKIVWNFSIIAASVVIAIVAATTALWLAVKVKSGIQRIPAAILMATAVSGMHYTGMYAATMVCTAPPDLTQGLLMGGSYVPFYVAAVAALVSAACLFVVLGKQVDEFARS